MSCRLRRSRVVVVALWALWSSPSLAANLGIVHGTVHDENGRPIPGVEVTLFARQSVRVTATSPTLRAISSSRQFRSVATACPSPPPTVGWTSGRCRSLGGRAGQDVTLPTLEETVTVVAPSGRRYSATVASSSSHLEREDIRAAPR
jgi:hypothetical protein